MKKLSLRVFLMALTALLVVCAVSACEDPVVEVSSVSVSPTSANLEVGGTVSLTATVSPSNATDKTVIWSSSNANVATVSGGIVKAVGEGTATITATAGGKKSTCLVTVSPVRIAVTGISLDKPDVSLAVGDTTRLVATITPADATDKSVAWSSSNTSVATVDANGIVTAVTPGTCTITAQSGNFSATCAVTCVTGGFPEGELPPDNEIWYTTSDNKLLRGTINTQGGKQAISHTKERGMGILRFDGPVTRLDRLVVLDNNAEKQLARLTGILVPDCVEVIGDGLLAYANGVKEFRIPAGLKQAGDACFSGWNKASLERFTGHHISEDGRLVIIDGVLYGFAPVGLTSYEIPAGVVKMMPSVCAYTPELKSIVLPAGLEEIGDMCFRASGLESVTIPASVKSLAHYAFKECFQLRNLLGDSHFISADRKYLYDPDWPYAPMVLTFFAGKDDTSYTIPEEIRHIGSYSFEGCSKLKSLTVPGTLESIGGEAFDGCDNLEALYGNNITSDNKGIMGRDHELLFLLPKIDEDYVVPAEVTKIGDKVFDGRQNLRSVTMGDQVTSIGSYAFTYCSSLKTLTLSANLKDFGGFDPIYHCDALEAVYLRALVPPLRGDLGKNDSPRLRFYVPSRTFSLYTSNTIWRQYQSYIVSYDYPDLPEPDFYISSDLSAEGEVTVYQKAADGRGIDLVFMGDAYTDRDVQSGLYMTDMKASVEAFFAVEPYKSFRNLFNIYIVTTVSATEGYAHGGGQSLGTNLVGTQIIGDDLKCFEMASKILQDDERMQDVLVIVCCNQPKDGPRPGYGTAYMYDPDTWSTSQFASGPSVVYFTKQDDSFESTGNVIRHECGHGFGKLLDEYVYSFAGRIPQDEQNKLEQKAAYGWHANVDFTSDPTKVKWSAFLSDERYRYDELGVFEGGATYPYGVWRPSQTSIMVFNVGRFNAPSRYAIWQRIHKLAYGSNWNGTYEDFVAYDVINRKTAPANAQSKVFLATPKQQRTAPPVETGRTWRQR